MKRTKSVVFVLALGLLTLAGASARMEAAQDGRLVIRYSPTLGINVGLVMRIDGRAAGAITKGHVYQRYLRPGPHLINVTRNGRGIDQLNMRLYVHPGETYSYVAKLPPSHVVLEPASLPR